MKHLYLLILLISFFIWNNKLSAQNVDFVKGNFKNQGTEFKQALEQINLGDNALRAKDKSLSGDALVHYLKAQKFNPKNSDLNFKIGFCYLVSTEKAKCAPYFEKAYELSPRLHPDIDYYLGRAYHLTAKWDLAINHYTNFKKKLRAKVDIEDIKDLDKKISECQFGKALAADAIPVVITNMGENINSKQSDYGMIFSPDSTELYFTSRRENPLDRRKDPIDNIFYEDIYTSKFDANSGWSLAVNADENLHSSRHNGVVTMSPDGKKLITFIDRNGVGYLYESERENGRWTKPKPMSGGINSAYHETTAWFSPDGKKLYFVSERPDHETKKDKKTKEEARDKNIFVAHWDEKSHSWKNIERLPANINTEYDEDGVYAHPDGKTLYFSSKGHNSIGGYDVFKTVQQANGSWSNPENIGYPVNTPDDDVFFILSADSKTGYYTSYHTENIGGKDLYKIDFLEKKAKEEGVKELKEAIEELVVEEPYTEEPIVETKTPKNETPKPEPIAIQEVEKMEVRTVSYEPKSEVPTSTKAVSYSNIYFDLNSSYLRRDAKKELDKVARLLNESPAVTIVLGAHTDCRESKHYNIWLSKRRAQRAADYLSEKISNGESRISTEFFGESKLLNNCGCEIEDNSNCSEEEHQLNRRVEIMVKGL